MVSRVSIREKVGPLAVREVGGKNERKARNLFMLRAGEKTEGPHELIKARRSSIVYSPKAISFLTTRSATE